MTGNVQSAPIFIDGTLCACVWRQNQQRLRLESQKKKRCQLDHFLSLFPFDEEFIIPDDETVGERDQLSLKKDNSAGTLVVPIRDFLFFVDFLLTPLS